MPLGIPVITRAETAASGLTCGDINAIPSIKQGNFQEWTLSTPHRFALDLSYGEFVSFRLVMAGL